MPDEDVIARINELANEEHELFGREARGEATHKERARLAEIEGQLDRLYDILHQRRARRNAGLDPDAIKLGEDIVSGVEAAEG
jgi:hypothetical protein